MNTPKQIGLVLSGHSDKTFDLTVASSLQGYVLKKIFIAGTTSCHFAKDRYPEAEITLDLHTLTLDPDLDVILVAVPINQYPQLVAEIVKTGKPIQIVA